MVVLLTILGCIIFIIGAYFMGNFMLQTFDDELRERVMSSIFGIFCWLGVAVICVIFFAIYSGISYLLK
jgi:hypothetical protein